MLKKISRLFLGLIVCASSACVTPTHASSAQNVIITRIQASGVFGAKDEYVVLHNNTSVEVDITNWCVMNKAAIVFTCFAPSTTEYVERLFIPAYGDAVAVSSEHANANGYPADRYTSIYEVTNQSSGSIVNGGDTVSLLNEDDEIIDTKAWSSAITTGKVLARLKVLAGPDIYATANETADWVFETRTLPPPSLVQARIVDITEPEINPDPGPEIPPTTLPEIDAPNEEAGGVLVPIITELLANPEGSDTGNEFIEFYNPHEHDVLFLDEFKLLVGIDSVKSYSFPAGASIPAQGYVVFTNQQLGYTLVNTQGRVQLAHKDIPVGMAVEYSSPKDNYSWALIDSVWRYTTHATPGFMNTLGNKDGVESSDESSLSAAKPCAVNQYRSPLTGRCKLIATATSTQVACKSNQERNPETNRCRTIASTTEPTPCKEGQERNPETNRCRGIVKMSEAGHALGVQSKADAAVSWYYWAAIGAILLLIVGYAVWEWREELAMLWVKVRLAFAKHSD